MPLASREGSASSSVSAVYLHVGSPKSGTTFVQHVLWENVDALRAAGVVLPGESITGQQRAVRDLRGIGQHETDPTPSWEGTWRELVAETLGAHGRLAIISEETLASLDEQGIEQAVGAFEGADVHVIYTMRNLAGLLPSEWQEYVKHRHAEEFESWLADVVDGGSETVCGEWFWRVHDAPEVLRRWAAHVPSERIHVVTLPPPGSPRDLLWRRMATALQIDPDIADLDITARNESLGLVETELLRRLNQEIPQDAPRWLHVSTVRDVLAHKVMSALPNHRKIRLPADRLPWVRERAHGFVADLRAGGYDIVGDLDDLLVEPPVRESPEPATETELLDTATRSLLGLLDHVAELHSEIDRLHGEHADERAKPLYKAVVRHISEKHPAVMRMRVAYWHFMERRRGLEPGTAPEPDTADRPLLFRASEKPA